MLAGDVFRAGLLGNAERRRPAGHQGDQFGDVLEDQKAQSDRHRGVRHPQARAPHCVGMPVLRPSLIPIERAENEKHNGKLNASKVDVKSASQKARARAEINRQHVDVDVAARHQHVGAADEGRADDRIGNDVDLPDRGQIEYIALDHHVADHEHGKADQEGGSHAGNTRQTCAPPECKCPLPRLPGCFPARHKYAGRRVAPAGRPLKSRAPLLNRQRLVDQLLAVRHVLFELRVGALLAPQRAMPDIRRR